MKKLNYFALFGAVAFNAFLFPSVFLTAIVLLFALWLVVGLFLVSPILLLFFNLTGLQAYSIVQTALSIILCAGGVVLYPIAKKTTSELIEFFKKYVKFNMKTIYQEAK